MTRQTSNKLHGSQGSELHSVWVGITSCISSLDEPSIAPIIMGLVPPPVRQNRSHARRNGGLSAFNAEGPPPRMHSWRAGQIGGSVVLSPRRSSRSRGSGVWSIKGQYYTCIAAADGTLLATSGKLHAISNPRKCTATVEKHGAG